MDTADTGDRILYEGEIGRLRAQPVSSVGQPFDPTRHEAVGTEAADDAEPGIIVREARRGWRLGDDLLRAAQVIVATASEPSDEERQASHGRA